MEVPLKSMQTLTNNNNQGVRVINFGYGNISIFLLKILGDCSQC